MNVSVIGGGSWGTTLAQVLSDNGHDVMIYDINNDFVKKINEYHKHPFFDTTIPNNIVATIELERALNFSDCLILCVPTKVIRNVISQINELTKNKKLFVNVSKGIEPNTSYRVSQIVEEVVDKDKCLGYVVLSGPSHAEEVILRKLTSLVAASTNIELAKKVQLLFSNDSYLIIEYSKKQLLS